MSFDLVASHYRWLEAIAFGNALQRARVAWLTEIGAPLRALVVGEGNGRFLCELLRAHPGVKVDCLDVSVRMLRLACERMHREVPGSQERVRFLQEDLQTWSPEQHTYDLVVTHFVLDCFTEDEIKEIVQKLVGAATQNAVWLLADSSIPHDFFGKLRAWMWLWVMHCFFRVVASISARQLTDPSPFLAAHSLKCVQRREWQHGVLKSELWRRDLREQPRMRSGRSKQIMRRSQCAATEEWMRRDQ